MSASHRATARQTRGSLEGQKVLLVEDEILIALDLEVLLMDQGAEVVLAHTLTEAFAVYADNGDIDLAVLDVRLGSEDVFPFAELLQTDEVPMVFHSAHLAPEEIQTRFPTALHVAKPSHDRMFLTALQANVS